MPCQIGLSGPNQIGLLLGLGLWGPNQIGLLLGLGLWGPKQTGLVLGLGLPGPKQIGLPLGLGLPAPRPDRTPKSAPLKTDSYLDSDSVRFLASNRPVLVLVDAVDFLKTKDQNEVRLPVVKYLASQRASSIQTLVTYLMVV
jgi:hypothetical protein